MKSFEHSTAGVCTTQGRGEGPDPSQGSRRRDGIRDKIPQYHLRCYLIPLAENFSLRRRYTQFHISSYLGTSIRSNRNRHTTDIFARKASYQAALTPYYTSLLRGLVTRDMYKAVMVEARSRKIKVLALVENYCISRILEDFNTLFIIPRKRPEITVFRMNEFS
jgi:hypothetical protein